jgi:hypothetical protein
MSHPRLSPRTLSAAVAAAAFAFTFAASDANASGSDRFGSSSAGTSLYNAGKQVYAEQLACKGCAFEGQAITAEIARKIVDDKKATEKLSQDDRDAVIAYAKKRFRI